MNTTLPTFTPGFTAGAALPYTAQIRGLSSEEMQALKGSSHFFSQPEFTVTENGLTAHFATREELQEFYRAVGYEKQEGKLLPVARFHKPESIISQLNRVGMGSALDARAARAQIGQDGQFVLHNLSKAEAAIVHEAYTDLFPGRPCGETDEMENGNYYFPSQIKFSGELHDAHEGLLLLSRLEHQQLRFANKKTILSTINRRFQPQFETSVQQYGHDSKMKVKITGLNPAQLYATEVKFGALFPEIEYTRGEDSFKAVLPSGEEASRLFTALQTKKEGELMVAINFRAPNVTRASIAESEQMRQQGRSGEWVYG